MSSLSSLEHTAIGGLAGVIEVSFMQPTVTIKNALQEGRALPRTPIGLYRGYLVSCYIQHNDIVVIHSSFASLHLVFCSAYQP